MEDSDPQGAPEVILVVNLIWFTGRLLVVG
ncbi:hypothetical protein NITHO_2920008 [Nitrolancea hollandica Lb]|uniref:Uncharacterized protein n=1 Tax=Nitrolancea hollandica Lb TaxID=1129897 RepID=I4EH04_9BACT|nr:hypothetical protein NITHO_2920008 [Nitrolancea hollandica Lb]